VFDLSAVLVIIVLDRKSHLSLGLFIYLHPDWWCNVAHNEKSVSMADV
jgi:hypothetical protein